MESLIEKLRKAARESFVYSDLLREAADAITELVHSCDVLDEQVTALYGALPKWIPISEKKPDDMKEVLFCYEWVGITGEHYKEIGMDTLRAMEHFGYKPIAWMPIQQPPEDDEPSQKEVKK